MYTHLKALQTSTKPKRYGIVKNIDAFKNLQIINYKCMNNGNVKKDCEVVRIVITNARIRISHIMQKACKFWVECRIINSFAAMNNGMSAAICKYTARI